MMTMKKKKWTTQAGELSRGQQAVTDPGRTSLQPREVQEPTLTFSLGRKVGEWRVRKAAARRGWKTTLKMVSRLNS